jgi:hypothetical protein
VKPQRQEMIAGPRSEGLGLVHRCQNQFREGQVTPLLCLGYAGRKHKAADVTDAAGEKLPRALTTDTREDEGNRSKESGSPLTLTCCVALGYPPTHSPQAYLS